MVSANKRELGAPVDTEVNAKKGPPAKMPGVQTKASTSTLASLSDLPPDLWANALGYARYEDCLRAFTVSRLFLNEVIPLVKEVSVFDKRALKVGPARRFTSVTYVDIACLFADPADAPPLPKRPAGVGYDHSTWDEIHAMVGDGDDYEGFARPLEVDIEVVTATVPFLSAFPSLEVVGCFFRYVVEAASPGCSDDAVNRSVSATAWEAVGMGERLETNSVDYYHNINWGNIETWSQNNDLNMRTLMLSVGGGYASGLLSSKVDVNLPVPIFSQTVTDDDDGPIFNYYCVQRDAENNPGEARQCVCHFICSAFPIEMVASQFGYGSCGCLTLTESMEHVLGRKGGRELLQSNKYILHQVARMWDRHCDKFGASYAKAGLPRPVITDLDIAHLQEWERRDLPENMAKVLEAYDGALMSG